MFGPSDQSFRNPEGAMGLVRIYGGVVLDESPPNEPAPSLRFLQEVALRTIPSGRFVGLECAKNGSAASQGVKGIGNYGFT
jgi:hypothetical protein